MPGAPILSAKSTEKSNAQSCIINRTPDFSLIHVHFYPLRYLRRRSIPLKFLVDVPLHPFLDKTNKNGSKGFPAEMSALLRQHIGTGSKLSKSVTTG
ncbi:hypothetical protein TNIN_85931 [Trichonephila inaurata madagascariensis]|uniref:Uncharacterized protein n=1 Tax=Trichonephila inaurata madagascariensis TaxID=2747483 RepID=A0A8X6Y028_9ARAC|nr:hypothetical protein TNIN_85931 [Trichonephila inaurata madagascariensis]